MHLRVSNSNSAIEYLIVKKSYIDGGGTLQSLYNSWDGTSWFAYGSSLFPYVDNAIDSVEVYYYVYTSYDSM